MKRLITPLLGLMLLGCASDDILPKPKGYLRLEYPKAEYKEVSSPLPFTFDKNKLASPVSAVKTTGKTKGLNVKYPSLKATIYFTYKEVNPNNLDSLLRDAQNLTQKHTIKADAISSNQFVNAEHNVYGMFYEIGGDAASQSQFYVTDSISHFLSGSLYFYTKPNYDSLYPAVNYLRKDIKRIMESIRWQE